MPQLRSDSNLMVTLILKLCDQARLNLNKRCCFLEGKELPKAETYNSFICNYLADLV